MLGTELQQLGLSKDEAQVYLALLEYGGGYVSRIAKKAGKNRATCYHTLNNLIEKGLASKVQKGSYLFFVPENPQKLVREAERKLETAKGLLPELLSIENTLAAKPKIRFFEGISGIETILEDTLTSKTEILGYTNLSSFVANFRELFRRYSRERVTRKIKTRYLSPEPATGIEIVREFFPDENDREFVEILCINPKEFPFDNEIAIYEKKVAIMSLSSREIMAILIESASVSATMKAVFDLSWLGATSFIAR